jgi:hypothetical protein
VGGGFQGVEPERAFHQLGISGGKNGLSRSSNLFHPLGGILGTLEFFLASVTMDM